jgi:deoxyribose-phosphate aldolase
MDSRSGRGAIEGALQQDFIVTKIESQPVSSSSRTEIAERIQSTLVSNCVTRAMWQKHIDDCLHYHFHAAMIPPSWVRDTARALRGSGIRVASFIDLPLGTMTTNGKAYEAGKLVQDSVDEIDLMPNVGFLFSGMEKEYFNDIRGVVEAAAPVPVKIMLELPLLNQSQRERAVQLSIDAGVAYLKNASSGAVGKASAEQIRWLRQRAPQRIRIKASGGIKTAQHVRELLDAGADLVGTSAGTQIMLEIQGNQSAGVDHVPDY